MAEYIDREKTKKHLDCEIDFGGLDNRLMVLGKIDDIPTADVIEIPKDATNGDILKIVFPNIEANEIKTDTGGYIEVKYLDTTDACDATAFRKNWWNAPYRKE